MKMKSSSSSSLSFGSKTHSFGCISLILQRFLCSGTSSTYPSDQIDEPSFEPPPGDREDEPGPVARLMSLDSIPKTRAVSRSRSVNSVDYLKTDNNGIQGKHRRVKSTLDQHQVPEYVELEDDCFFILSFEKDEDEKGFGELKQIGTRKCKKRRENGESQTRKEGKENNISSANTLPGCEKLKIEELKQHRKEKRKNRRKRREIKLRHNMEKDNWIKSYGRSRDGDLANCEVRSKKEEGESDDWSPVSVLDYDYDRFAGVQVTEEPVNTSRRRLSSELESSKPNETIQDHIRLTNIQDLGYQEMWLMICRLNVSEMEGSNWVYGKASKLEDLEGIISDDIVSHILDQLLEETITTLSLTSV